MQDSLNQNAKVNGRWTHEQHLIFLEGLRIYGKNWKKIQLLIKTRTGTQIRSHAQKFFMKVHQNQPKNDERHFEGECHEGGEQQSQTQNSKIADQIDSTRQNSSYYLNKILEHSTDYGVSDFWTALVDCKHQPDTKESTSLRHSFQAYSKSEGQIVHLASPIDRQ